MNDTTLRTTKTCTHDTQRSAEACPCSVPTETSQRYTLAQAAAEADLIIRICKYMVAISGTESIVEADLLYSDLAAYLLKHLGVEPDEKDWTDTVLSFLLERDYRKLSSIFLKDADRLIFAEERFATNEETIVLLARVLTDIARDIKNQQADLRAPMVTFLHQHRRDHAIKMVQELYPEAAEVIMLLDDDMFASSARCNWRETVVDALRHTGQAAAAELIRNDPLLYTIEEAEF